MKVSMVSGTREHVGINGIPVHLLRKAYHWHVSAATVWPCGEMQHGSSLPVMLYITGASLYTLAVCVQGSQLRYMYTLSERQHVG